MDVHILKTILFIVEVIRKKLAGIHFYSSQAHTLSNKFRNVAIASICIIIILLRATPG